MNWEWAKAQLKTGNSVVRASERRRAIEDVNGAEVRWLGREGITMLAGFDVDGFPASILIGTMSRTPFDCSLDDLDATDWALE